MKTLLAVLVLFVSGCATLGQPVDVFEGNGVRVELFDAPCTAEKVVARIKPDAVGDFNAAVVKWQGKDLAACWTLLPISPEVKLHFVIDETGDMGFLDSPPMPAPGTKSL